MSSHTMISHDSRNYNNKKERIRYQADYICGPVNNERYEFTAFELPLFALKIPSTAAPINDTQQSKSKGKIV